MTVVIIKVCVYKYVYIRTLIKVHDSVFQGQEEVLKFVLNKLTVHYLKTRHL